MEHPLPKIFFGVAYASPEIRNLPASSGEISCTPWSVLLVGTRNCHIDSGTSTVDEVAREDGPWDSLKNQPRDSQESKSKINNINDKLVQLKGVNITLRDPLTHPALC